MDTPSKPSGKNTAGSPDLSYGNTSPKNGTVFFDQVIGPTRASSDGSIVTVGSFLYNGALAIGGIRHKPDGARDTAHFFPNTTTEPIRFAGLKIQPDAKLLILGVFETRAEAFMTRLHPDGQLDSQFGTAGTTLLDRTVDYGSFVRVGFEVQANGNILVAFANRTLSYIFQLNDRGELINFGQPGPVTLDNTRLNTLVLSPDGFIVAGSQFGRASVMSFRHDGTPNPDFGDQGVVVLPLTENSNKHVTALARSANGEIVAVGTDSVGQQEHSFLTSLLATGETNPQFHGGTPIETSTALGSYNSVVIQADGKIVVLARQQTAALFVNLIRYTTAGKLDSEFGAEGVAPVYNTTDPSWLLAEISTLEVVQPGGALQCSGTLPSKSSWIGRFLSQ